jgi:trigger factor
MHTVEVLSSLERKINISVPEDQVDQKVKERMQKMLPEFQLKGFRPGKVPLSLLQQRFGKAVRGEVIGEIIDSTYREVLTQEKLMVAGMPDIQIVKDVEGAPLEYHATVEVYPQISLQGLESVEIENITVEVAQKDVDEMIQKLRRKNAKWSVVERASKKGDKVTVSFEGRKEGALFEGGSGKNVSLELGSGTAIPGFEEGFTGIPAGESVTMTLTFPADYHATDLAGQSVEFTGTLHTVEEAELPPLDEAFAKELGVEEGGIEELRKKVLENIQAEVQQKAKEHAKEQLLEKILELHPLDIPKVLLEKECKRIASEQEGRSSGSPSMQKLTSEEIEKIAKRRVHLGLLLGEFVEKEKLTPDPARVDALIQEIAVSYPGSAEMIVKLYHENQNLHGQIVEKVLEDQLIEKLISQTKVLEKNMPYTAFKVLKSYVEV